MALPAASTTTSSSSVRPRAKPSSPDRVMSTRPCGRSRPSSQTTTSAKVRWMSIPITRFTRLPSVRGHGSGGRHDNYGSALAAQPGGSQGRPATNSSSRLIEWIGLPTLRAPGAPQPGWSHHTRGSRDPHRLQQRHEHHASYRPARAGARRLRGERGEPGRGRAALPGRRADTLRLAADRPRGGAPPSEAAPRWPSTPRRRAGGAGRPGGGAERRHPGRVRRPARRAHGRAAQRLGPVPGAEGARPGAEEKTVKAAEQDREDVAEARRAWRAELAGIDPARLVFIDETGIDTRMTRAHARAARGERAVGKVPRGRWERLTVIGALALDGVVASRGVAAATGTAVFLAFAEEVLIPALRERPDALVVMDNPGAHKAEAVRGALDRAGLAHRYLPSYSPDMNPIEQAWSKLKARLRAVGARSKEALEAALGPALATITAQDARGWFRLAGYPAAD